jgi:predicted dehydrogenase
MSYRSAILGCGPRSQGHAKAYEQISRGQIVACCDMDEQRLNTYGERHSIANRYTDLDQMLQREQPHVVHLVTPPTLRVGLMTQLAEAGVPGVIVEKPICIGADDYKALRALEQTTQTKFVVNHQLRHQPKLLELLAEVAAGQIGEVRFLDASAVLPMSGQGVHVLDLIFAFVGYEPVATVFGASSGYDDIDGSHPGPNTAETLITFSNGMRAALQAGAGAPSADPALPNWAHKRIAVYGTHGFRHWWMYGSERGGADGQVEKLKHDYAEQDVRGQAGLTNALFDWLDDDNKPSPTNLKRALDEWLVILAGYLSTIEARPIDLPFDPPDDLLDRFKRFVGAA